MARLISGKEDTLAPLGEVFRKNGYSGASLSAICDQTGLGKSSLYHFYPGGKAEMLDAVLDDIDQWFETNVFAVLSSCEDGIAGIHEMLDQVEEYFRSGRRICLIGCVALSDPEDMFSIKTREYFQRWIDTLSQSLNRAGYTGAIPRATDIVASIQGAIVLAQALDEPRAFQGILKRIRDGLG